MTTSHARSEPPAAAAPEPGAAWLYRAFFATQTVGALVFFSNGIPLYREVLADPSKHQAGASSMIWVLAAIVLIQVGFWVCHRLEPRMFRFTSVLLSQIMLFFGRMAFVFASTIFGFVFIANKPNYRAYGIRYLVILAGLFSLYCYTQELERVARTFHPGERR